MVGACWVGKVHGTVSIVVHAGTDVVTRASTVLVVVDLVGDLFLEIICCRSERRAVPRLVLDEESVVEIVVEAREEDQGVGVVAVHSFCRRNHIVIPGVPRVGQSVASWIAELIAESDRC